MDGGTGHDVAWKGTRAQEQDYGRQERKRNKRVPKPKAWHLKNNYNNKMAGI